MNKSLTREVIFFVLVFLLFFLGNKVAQYWAKRSPKLNRDLIVLVVGAVATLAVVGIFYLAKMNQIKDNYQMLEFSPGALCRGGPYMWQGDSERAKMCRKLASTPEGRCDIAAFNCPNSYNGLPQTGVRYTSNSDSCWKGVHCKCGKVDHAYYDKDHGKDCNCGMCSMWDNGK